MYHHSVSICRDLLFDEVVIENTQSDDILKWQSDPDRFLGFDWVYSQEEKLKLIMRCNLLFLGKNNIMHDVVRLQHEKKKKAKVTWGRNTSLW